ncbi:MAG: immunoglobulin domain-containing protein [Bacteroidetes bacterium]|nr:immunoglobulin domain-containing protein [Bacteroidota bacterium]
MQKLLSLSLFLFATLVSTAQWNPNTSVNLEIATLPVADMHSLPTSTGKTWIAFYHQNSGNYDMRAQLLDVDGTKLLGPDGVLIDNKPSGTATFVFNICKDANDNLIVAYQDQRSGQLNAVAYKISQTGAHLWSNNGVILGQGLAPYPAVLSNGETVVTWIEATTNTLQIQKISTAGVLAWLTPVTVQVGTANTTRGQVVSNLNGNFTLVFQRRGFGIATTLYAQRYNSSGVASWTSALQLSTETTSGARYYSVLSEEDTTYCGYYSAQGSRFNSWLHRINPNGTLPYGGNGSNFSTATSGADPYQQMTNIATDSGSPLVWSVCSYSNTSQSQYGVYVQKFNKQTGARLLTDNALNIYPISASFDTQAGGLALVNDAPVFMSYDANYKIYATRLDGNGAFVWTGNRVELSSTTASAGSPKGRYGFSALSNSQAVGVWAETRNGVQRAYAQNITPSGTTGVATAGFSFTTPSAAVAACPAPASISIQLSTTASGSFSGAISLTASGIPAGTSLSFSSNPVNVGSNTTVTLTGTNTLAPGSYTITVTGTATGVNTQNVVLTYTITAPPSIIITSQPSAQVACIGTTISYAVVATGNSLTYQWQQSLNGCNGPWQDISSATAATLSLGAVTVSQNNTGYRCVIASPCATTVISNCGLLTVGASPTITTHPVSQTVCEGTTVNLTVAANGSGLLYQWQVNTNGVWTNIGNGVGYSGVTTTTLVITGVVVSMSGAEYRCVISTAACPTLVSSISATLTINTLTQVISHPASHTICLGTSTFMTTDAIGTGVQFQWQVNTGTGFTNISNGGAYNGTTTSQLSITTPPVGWSGYIYRCVVTGVCPPAVNTNPATLTIHAPATINRQPVSAEVCAGSGASFIIAVSSVATVNYDWQQSTNGGTTWTSLPSTLSPVLQFVNLPLSYNGNRYRCIVSNATCPQRETSAVAQLSVRANPTVGLTAAPTTSLLPGQSTTLTATPSASTGGVISTNWTLGGQPYSPGSGNTVVATITNLGTYQVGVRETWSSGLFCAAQSSSVTITAMASDRLFIFPSPNNGNFSISYYNAGGVSTTRQLAIFDSKGARVYQEVFPVSGPYTILPIDLQKAARGIYFIVIGDAAGKKLIEGKAHVW